jgi:hypothetical protein
MRRRVVWYVDATVSRNLLSEYSVHSSAMRMEAAGCSETLVAVCQSKRRMFVARTAVDMSFLLKKVSLLWTSLITFLVTVSIEACTVRCVVTLLLFTLLKRILELTAFQ